MTLLCRADRRCLLLLALFLLTLYAFTASGRITSGDGESMYLTTQALITGRHLSIPARPEAAVGRGGRSYSKYGVGQSAAQAPFFVAGHVVRKLAGAPDDRTERFAVSLTNPVLTALLASVLWLLLRELGCGRSTATAGVLVFGAGTLAWPYSRADFSEPLQALTLLTAFYGLVRWRRRPSVWWAALAGSAAGFSFITKAASLVLLLPLGLYFAYALWERCLSSPVARGLVKGAKAAGWSNRVAVWAGQRIPRFARNESEAARNGGGASSRSGIAIWSVTAAAVPFAWCGLLQAALNYYRFGRVTEFGYGSEPATGFTTPLFLGIQFLLVSSGKGLFWFAPPVLVGLVGLPWLARRYRPEACAAALVFLAELAYYARWWAWHGDWCWGPRYMVVTVPFVMLGWIPLLASWRAVPILVRALAITAAMAGVTVAILGTAIDYGNYYSVVADQIGQGVDVRDARLDPPFSPLLGHAWLARASAYDALAGSLHSLGGNGGSGGGVENGRGWDSTQNPFLAQYPWAGVRPDLVPAAPERAVGFAPWFAALTERPAFILYWSGMVAVWLALTLIFLGHRLWRAAAAERAVAERRARTCATRNLDDDLGLVTA